MDYSLLASIRGKAAVSAAAGAVAGALRPMLAPAVVCTVMVMLDFASAYALSRRLRRRGHPSHGKLSSARFGRVIATLARVYGALAVAALAQAWVIGPDASFNAVRFIAGAICFWQLLSILENESTCSDAAWARIARRFLIDKARRHLS